MIFQLIDPLHITAHPKNPRTSVGDVTELAESIRGSGVLEPLIVIPADHGRFQLIAGHRRLAASREAGLAEVPCIVRDDLTSEAEQIEAMITENLHRSDLTPIEEGDAYQALLELDVSVKQLAKRTGHTQKTIRNRVAVAMTPMKVRAAVTARQISLDDALAVAGFEDVPEVQQTLVEAIGGHNFQWALEQARHRRAAQKKMDALRVELAAQGHQVITADEWGSVEHLVVVDVDDSDQAVGGWQWTDIDGNDPANAPEGAVVAVVVHQPYSSGPVRTTWVVREEFRADGTSNLSDGTSDGSDDDDGPSTAAERGAAAAERKAAQAEAEQVHADLQIAATVRRSHIRQSIESASVDQAIDVLRTQMWDLKPTQAGDCEAIGFEGVDPAWHIWLNTRTLPQLVLTQWVLDNTHLDNALTKNTQYVSTSRHLAEYTRLLGTTLGHEWSEVELEAFGDIIDGAAADVDGDDY